MIDSLTSLATGGLLGLVGSLLNKGFTLFDQMNQEKQQQAMRMFELKRLRLMQQGKMQQQAQQRFLQHDQSRTIIREASYTHDSQLGKASRWQQCAARCILAARYCRSHFILYYRGAYVVVW